MRRTPRGFTLFELVVIVMIIGMVALIVVPTGGLRGSSRVASAANILAADLEYCQSACIANPGTPLAITFNATLNQYVLAPANAPNATATFPGDSNQPYRNDFSTGRYAALQGVQIVSFNGQPVGRLTFDAYGRPMGCDDHGTMYSIGTATIVLQDTGSTLTVMSDATTGDVSIQ